MFESLHANPDVAEGEGGLALKYGDKFQWFALAPWHAVTFRLTQNAGANFGLENAIPVLDLGGFRYQWGSGRIQSFRTGVGVLYFKDQKPGAPIAGAINSGTTTEPVFNFALQGNANWAGFSVGVGYVPLGESDAFPRRRDRVRLLVGADLIRVFSGSWAEAL